MKFVSVLFSCALASDSFKRFSTNSENTEVTHDFSYLTSVEAIQQHAVIIIKSFIDLIVNFPEQSFRCDNSSSSARPQLLDSTSLVRRAKQFLPFSVKDNSQKIESLFKSLDPIIISNPETSNVLVNIEEANKARGNHESHKQIIEEMLKEFHSFHLYSFKRLVKLSSFLVDFFNYLDVGRCKIVEKFRKSMEALEEREAELTLQDSENYSIGHCYAVLTQRLTNQVANMDLTLTRPPSSQFSAALNSMIKTVLKYSELSSNDRDSLMNDIDDIVFEERKVKLEYKAWKKKINLAKSEEISGTDNE